MISSPEGLSVAVNVTVNGLESAPGSSMVTPLTSRPRSSVPFDGNENNQYGGAGSFGPYGKQP